MKMGNGSDLVIETAKGFDPGFKLFGKTIPMGCCVPYGIEIKQSEKLLAKQEEDPDPVAQQSSSLESNKDNGSEGNPEGEEEVRSTIEGENNNNNEGKNGEKPALKKPDKLLPCPRCESMDTKFCYYNNYNVNQPRHFCKNCQRYWTAGGTLRNVPVGAGRRKNKHSAVASTASSTHYRQIRSASDVVGIRSEESEGIMIPCSLPAPCVKVGALGGSRVQVLPFEVLDSGAPKVVNGGCSASGSTVLNFAPQGGVNRGDCEQMEWQKQNRDEISCGSSVTGEREILCNLNTASVDGHNNNPNWPNGSSVPGAAVPFFAGPWPFGWNFAAPTSWGAVPWPMVTGSPHLGAWPPAPWITAPWAVPAANGCNSSLDNGPPTLGKRSQSEAEGKQPNGCLWVPKTLRIDDPGEAAKSSFWTTLGLGDKPDSITSGRVMFKAFQPKTEGTKDSCLRPEPAAEALCANPAAFSRSVSFQESN